MIKTKTEALEAVRETLSYCWGHSDTKQEDEMILWVAEKLAFALGERYEFPQTLGPKETIPRCWVIDGPRQCITSAPRKAVA